MWNCCYDIAMQTPIGVRYGTMAVNVNQNVILGIINILKKTNSFSGKIDHEGNCRIHGKIITLTRTISYDGEGQITKNEVHLRLKDRQECFDVSGSASVSEPEGERKPEI